MPDVSIRMIGSSETALMDAVFALYRDSIEQSEQRPEAEFRALAQRHDYRFIGALMEGELIGIAVSWIPANGDIWLFEYAAVASHMCGNGVGANLFFATRYVAGQHRTALIEVDAYSGAGDQARRLAFYKRLGCLKLRGLDYRLPLDAFGPPPPMWLLALPQQETVSVSVHHVEDWLRRIYFEVYGKNLDDPRLALMIDPLPDDVSLDPLSDDPATP